LNSNYRALKNSNIVILGLSYKENVGDLRESPVKYLINYLKKMDANITVIDPYINPEVMKDFGVNPGQDVYTACEGADALVLMTGHEAFSTLDFTTLHGIMRTRVCVDGRRMFKPEEVSDFTYRAIGRDHQLDAI